MRPTDISPISRVMRRVDLATDGSVAGDGIRTGFPSIDRWLGGGVRPGRVYGESDRFAAYVKDRPVVVQDLGATIFHAMNIAPETRTSRDGFTRPVSTGRPLLELF